MTADAIATNSATDQSYKVETIVLFSEFLDRDVKMDIYLPLNIPDSSQLRLMLVNDGQDLPAMPFEPLLSELVQSGEVEPLLVVGIYCSADRKLEYGTADELDYMNRGSRAKYYRKFILKELLPWISAKYRIPTFREKIFAGFSLGALSALDIAWTHPEIFSCAGVFSGSLWWRSKDLKHGYVEETDRIMHKLVRQGTYQPNMRFFFQTGCLDEKMDRNNNGIIDSIDDTLAVIEELERHGYQKETQIMYLELEDGRHDVPTWAKAFPDFLRWACGKNGPVE